MKRKKRRRKASKSYANWLDKQNYPSDVWLKKQWADIQIDTDEFNSCEGRYIPDLINRKWKYIIECDGASHESEDSKIYDRKRDITLTKRGYIVLRVKFGDFIRMERVKNEIKSRRNVY